jgi:phenylpyruvate tautomerase PptA (4-oxalocrotonate tautomerase family)
MPLLNIHCSKKEITKELVSQIESESSSILSETLKKSADFIMIKISAGENIAFARDSLTPAIYMEVKNVGEIKPATSSELAKRLTALMHKILEVSPERTYIEFQQSERHLWGWAGKTFDR